VTDFPTADTTAARTLGAVLRHLDYSEDGITGLLGEDAFETGQREAPVHLRRLPETKLATAVQLLFLQLPASTGDAAKAFGKRGLEALERTGLVRIGDAVVPQSRITAIGDVLLASDGFSRDVEDPTDYVATYTPTSRLLDVLTPRARIRRAIDIGTGPGIHALLAARHSDVAVATDVNPRALAYTELNAALNGLDNVEIRHGSFFEPAGDETFDLITCNAPFVVSPERRWTYRDAGYEADELSELLVREAARRLADGGFAALLVSWVAHDEDEPDERAIAWVEASGCDGWILPVFDADPLEHAAGWNDHLAADPATFGVVIDAWTEYLGARGVERVTEGAILLHKRGDGRKPELRIDEIEEDELEPASDQVLLAFENRERLRRMKKKELLAARLAPAMPLSVELAVPARRNGHALVHLDDGTRSDLETAPEAARTLERLDGETRLVDAIRPQYERPTLKLVRELLELGALRFATRDRAERPGGRRGPGAA
jgi:methylase of polypeptide subunit release factors